MAAEEYKREQEPHVEARTEKEHSVAGLFRELANEVTTLVRKEVELARVETGEKVSQATGGMAAIAVGGFLAFAGLLVLLDAAVYSLSQIWQPWVAALVVGAVVAVIGLLVLQKGRSNLKAGNLKPQRTADTVKRDKEFVQRRLK